jgi:hypothetical protein
LRPLKVRDLLPSFAMEMGNPVDEVQAVMSYYYKAIRQRLTQIENVNIHLENLGTFYIKERALNSYIEKCEYIITELSNNSIKEYASKVDYKERLAKVQNMKNILLEEKQRRKDVINKRFNNESDKNLEK